MKRKAVAGIFAGILCIGLVGCGSSSGTTKTIKVNASASEVSAASADTEETAASSAAEEENEDASGSGAGSVLEGLADGVLGGGTLTINDDIQQAMDVADTLTSGSYINLEDGSILTRETSYNDQALYLASVDNLKRVVYASGNMTEFALTEEGDLYFYDTKILDNLTDASCTTTNANIEMLYIQDNAIGCVYTEDLYSVRDGEEYIPVGDQAVISYLYRDGLYVRKVGNNEIPLSGELVRLSMEKADSFVLNSEGDFFLFDRSGDYEDIDFKGWNQLAVIDSAKLMLSQFGDDDREYELTVAGIQGDGTVLATGTYADDILSWGKLSYISMDTGLIVGLKPDGTLCVTGRYADAVSSQLATIDHVEGVKVGDASGDNCINIVDADGVHYYLEYDEVSGYLREQTFTTTTFSSSTSEWIYKYNHDGTVYRSNSDTGSWVRVERDEDGGWEEVE